MVCERRLSGSYKKCEWLHCVVSYSGIKIILIVSSDSSDYVVEGEGVTWVETNGLIVVSDSAVEITLIVASDAPIVEGGRRY